MGPPAAVGACCQKFYSCHYRIGTVSEWLNDCEQFALQHAPDHPVLYYHLSLINALTKQIVKSRKHFNNYLSKYVCILVTQIYNTIPYVFIICTYVCVYVRMCL